MASSETTMTVMAGDLQLWSVHLTCKRSCAPTSPVVPFKCGRDHHLRKEARWGGICGARHALPASECQGAAGPAGGGWTADMGSDMAALHGSHRGGVRVCF